MLKKKLKIFFLKISVFIFRFLFLFFGADPAPDYGERCSSENSKTLYMCSTTSSVLSMSRGCAVTAAQILFTEAPLTTSQHGILLEGDKNGRSDSKPTEL
jgi:hypothetical protein